ncbi:MAG: FAD-binding protein [Bacteroidetes bacterium GWC2_33_15]|nr:MAG: FAD-binding protein [Bacteroidetes bacterium GWA2_33_15]OFX50597.1 MAG: FAD-binding protein [Bacteroidetes bacterium GWC2_33_15]OFX64134.1 MAG: FAD-binding protein [Bacteroidetes bacterium GWB2_32_14]OFX69746.1 MAG: FAD-binding protein [Bacteroidetes bacterium GWD2_33_33]HAN19783.1 FAD-binding oxidoreductase [Bacteroidales bacterium]
MLNNLNQLKKVLEGDLFTDYKTKILYATDASVYREVPLAVCRPKNSSDLKKLIDFANTHKTSLIPRTAGTSLAGQVVGSGIIVDVSKYFTEILELNVKERWVRVQPGVILDELNMYLKPYGLFFGPETSTSNRCMIGGMVGNNACGSHSIIYGTTRDHTLSTKVLLSSGDEVEFGPLSVDEFKNKCIGDKLENKIYNHINKVLSDTTNQNEIREQYPHPSIYRRNTGYAIDVILETDVFTRGKGKFNFSKLICGSEGTLGLITEIKLNLVDIPPSNVAVITVHLNSKEEAFKANLIALKHKPGAVEMMDNTILNLTKGNRDQSANRYFIEGDPGAILIIEFTRESIDEINTICNALIADFKKAGYGYHFPIIYNNDTKKVWNLRKAGLGVLSNMPGDAKPVSIIEDTAVHVEVLPDYMADFKLILDKYKLDCVYHAHIGSGELHLRPILNLKDAKDVEMFRTIGLEIAHLVKKYKGSLSGEHGDGRVRGEFIPIIIGEQNYKLLQEIKGLWDPNYIFNPGKITDVPSMINDLRYEPGRNEPDIKTIFDFSEAGGILRAAEKCNGSGDCRKTEKTGGTMCPSYMATRNESDVTRARANILREFLTHSPKKNPFDHKEIKDVMDLCLSCKACKSECPSSVDVAKLKAEFLQHYYDAHGIPVRSRLIAYITEINKLASIWPWFYNLLMKNRMVSTFIMKIIGFAPERSMPLLSEYTLNKWVKKYIHELKNENEYKGKIYLFNDEFTNFNDSHIGIKAVQLLTRLGYEVVIPKHIDSGRTYLSKGLLRRAKRIALKNVNYLRDVITENSPLIGIEPSAILTFRDEYPDLVGLDLKPTAKALAKNALMIDEFLKREMERGNITKSQFTPVEKKIKLHGHCQQKAVASTDPTKYILSFPTNYRVEEIPSGCCGMAGSFGFEKEHYAISMKIGEMVLFPAIRNAEPETIIAAPGTSCRSQIKDGTGRKALHPVEILYEALI